MDFTGERPEYAALPACDGYFTPSILLWWWWGAGQGQQQQHWHCGMSLRSTFAILCACSYFASRFPNLLVTVYVFAVVHLREDQNLAKYWTCAVESIAPFVKAFAHHHPVAGKHAAAPAPYVSSAASPHQTSRLKGVGDDTASVAWSSPPLTATGAATASSPAAVVVGYEVCGGEEPLHVLEFPKRPGRQPCDFYVKTGHCKFLTTCCFDHPDEFAVMLTEMDLPHRPTQPVCAFYLKQNSCKFGPSCKYHHPRLVPVHAGSATVLQSG